MTAAAPTGRFTIRGDGRGVLASSANDVQLYRIWPPGVPLSRVFASAYQRGFDARLRGVSRFSSPYDERTGWAGAFYRAWQDGWLAADAITDPAPHVCVDDDYPPA